MEEVTTEDRVALKFDQLLNTYSVVKYKYSTNSQGTVIVPSYIRKSLWKYKVTSINEKAFENRTIYHLSFQEDSEMESFESNSLYGAHITKLTIPANLKYLKDGWCCNVFDLKYIEISDKNNLFFYYDNKYLLGKNQENDENFDIFHYACYNIKEAIIPSQVKIIKKRSFDIHKYLELVTFPENSKLLTIEDYAFSFSSIKKLVLPASINNIGDRCFSNVPNLINLEISPENTSFLLFENKYLLKKSNNDSDIFDVLIFARRDIDEANIPSNIKIISFSAFEYCKNLKNITFESNSSLEIIKPSSFSHIPGPEKIIFPPSLKEINYNSFIFIENIKMIEFQSKSIKIGNQCFNSCNLISFILFPNADFITLDGGSFFGIPKNAKILIKQTTKLLGIGMSKFQNQIGYIEKDIQFQQFLKETKHQTKKEPKRIITPMIDTKIQKEKSSLEIENDNLKKYVSFIQKKFENCDQFISYEEFLLKKEISFDKTEKNYLIDNNDEKHHKNVGKIGEGSTCDVYKVIDERTGDIMCKKVIKANRGENHFKLCQNTLKEIEILLEIKHPCICKAIGYNLQEEIPSVYDDDEIEDKTTIAIFFELLPYSIKKMVDSGLMNNTLKVKIAIEVAFGMSYIHSFGMIHRDLKIGNIMLNSIFESKIIDFGLVYVSELNDSDSTMTKGIGTLAYMSPEMINEEKYDNKTDVYSYGILLFALFTGNLPKQTMKERLGRIPIKFPKVSSKISDYCINLIKRCTSFESEKRPSFDEIIEDLAKNSFSLADDVNLDIINHRYDTLNLFRKR